MIRHFVSQVRRAAVHRIACSVALAALAGTAAAQVTPIAQIQANPAAYVAQSVTVEGVVTIPVNYRGPMAYSAYIQDGSGRGINLFGGSATAPPFLNTTGNKVQVTGEVQIFSETTVELINISAVNMIGSGIIVPPIELSTQDANDPRWEGTLIQVAGTISSSVATMGPARNYTMSDGSGSIVARVYTAIGIPTLPNATAVVGRGAGTNDTGTFQYYVGQPSDFAAGTLPQDTAAPQLVGSWAPSRTTIEITFNEPMETATAGTAGSYEVFQTAAPASTVPVSSVTLNGPVATLTLGGSMAIQTDYAVRVSGVRDSDGNQISASLVGGFHVGGTVDTTPPTLSSAGASTLTAVTATFSEALDPATGGIAGNYTVAETANPGTTIAVQSASVAGSTATLTLASAMTGGTNYTLRVTGVNDQAGNTIVGTATAAFTAPGGGTTTPIADIHANLGTMTGQVVTVEGIVYIPANYRGTLISGYIQDESGRGVNLFGNTTPNAASLNTVGNRVRVTGTVAVFGGTTVELMPITAVTLVSSGNAISPQQVSTAVANNANFEGTFIEITGTVSGSTPGTTGTNYTVNDGSGAVDVRVVNTLNVAQIPNNTRIFARGAGSNFMGTYQILVGRATDIGTPTGGDTTPPTLSNASSTGGTAVQVNFSESVDPVTGGTASNYAVFETATPSNTKAVSAASVSGSRATLTLASALTNGTQYTVRAQGVKDIAGNTMPAPQTANFTPGSASGITPIATIQANPQQFSGMTVTVQGQVYIPSNYRGATTSGYIQDDSGRGINLFGSGANVAAAQNVGNIIRVTGSVEIFGGTTVEVTNITALTLVSSGNPPLCPVTLSTADAGTAAWEGTFIQVRGTINGISITGAGTATAAHNYVVDDGDGAITVRVVDNLSAPTFTAGQVISAKGAGSNFNGTSQILVGQTSAVSTTAFPDACGPSIVRASSSGGTDLLVQFSEPVQTAEAQTASNYEVFRTNSPGTTIAVTSAVLQGDRQTVQLTLASALTVNLGYTVRVRNVRDEQGNAVSSSGVTRIVEETLAETVSVNGPPFTFLPRTGERYPISFTVPSKAANGAAEVVVRIFDLQGRLKKTLFDSRFVNNAFTNNRRTETWDGRDDVAQIVPAGTYVVHLLVTGERSGERQEAQMPVVVATRLDR